MATILKLGGLPLCKVGTLLALAKDCGASPEWRARLLVSRRTPAGRSTIPLQVVGLRIDSTDERHIRDATFTYRRVFERAVAMRAPQIHERPASRTEA